MNLKLKQINELLDQVKTVPLKDQEAARDLVKVHFGGLVPCMPYLNGIRESREGTGILEAFWVLFQLL